ncbi:MAG: PDZ domain-containing protein [Deltaproteobacteria bacterium]|nr:PDZ domain-containing protein [Deltaproteobacteria bacterium]
MREKAAQRAGGRVILLVLWLAGALLSTSSLPAATDPAYRLSEGEVFARVIGYLKQNYIDPQRIDAQEMLRSGLQQLARAVPEILALFDGNQAVTITIDQASRRFPLGTVGNLSDLAKLQREIFAFIELHYHGKTEPKELEYLVVDGMLNALDPHSALLTPKIYNEFKIGTKGNFGGIGIAIGAKDGELTVIAPIEGTPAWRAGLKANDRIMQIGEESTINMSLTEAVEKLRGRVGTSVTMTLERSGRAPFTVTLKRAVIEIDSVQSVLLREESKTVGYIKVKSFQENTEKDFVTHLARLTTEAGGMLDGVILDLRNNPGGLLQQAVAIADLFLADGIIVSTVGANRRFLEEDEAHRDGTEPPYPLIVLVNEGSASASEIVAGALQVHRRALLVGSRTFGKGSVQTVYDLRDGSALKLTIAQYLTGGKNSIQSVGVTPDVALLPITVEKAAMNLVEDKHASEKDLERHLLKEGAAEPATLARHHLRYLTPPEATPSEDEATRREYSNKPDVQRDFAVGFARQLLVGGGWTSQGETPLLTARIKETEGAEAQRLIAALKDIGIPWQHERATGKPQLQITYQLESKDGTPVKSAAVGEEIQLRLTAQNVGSGPFSQLLGTTTADEPFLDNKEFVFGYLPPGGRRSWTVPLKVPSQMTTATLPVTVEFHEANLNQPSSFIAMVPIQGNPRPQFAYHYRLGPPVGSKVRPQGLLPLGKSIPLYLEVKNIGEGASAETVATIKNTEGKGPFIELGRVKLGRLPPGGIAKAAFRFRLDPAFEAATFAMELAVTDAALMEAVTNQIEFTVGSGEIKPAAGPWYQGPEITMTGLVLPAITAGPRQRIVAKIRDDQRVKDYFIFVGDDKVFYQANSQEGNSLSLETEIALKVGGNFVTVAARDNNDLLSRRTVFILRTGDGNTAMKQ